MKAVALAIMNFGSIYAMNKAIDRGRTGKQLAAASIVSLIEMGFLFYFLYTGQ